MFGLRILAENETETLLPLYSLLLHARRTRLALANRSGLEEVVPVY